MHFGTALEKELRDAVADRGKGKHKKPLSEAQRNGRTQKVLQKWLGEEVVQKKYRDPAAKFKREG